MFSNVHNFIYRHRNKFLIGGGLIGGIALLSRYAEYKLFQWHESEAQALIRKKSRREHFEKTKETANATVLTLSNNLVKVVCEELDTDSILQLIKIQPENKQKLWEHLKVVGFARCLSCVYSSAVVGSFVHIQLMLLGSYTYGDIIEPGHAGVNINYQVQENYLSLLQNFIQVGLPVMFQKILSAVKHCISPLPLDKKITLEALEGILKDITLLLAGEESLEVDDQPSLKLLPFSQYISKLKKSINDNPEECILNKMTEELLDVIDGDDFKSVIQILVQHGINYVLDYAANCYPPPQMTSISNHSANNNCENPDTDFESKGAKPKHINGQRLEMIDKEGLNNVFLKSSIPLAKLIPVLSGIVHTSLSPAPGHLLQSVLLNEQMENLSFNVYEAFSVGL